MLVLPSVTSSPTFQAMVRPLRPPKIHIPLSIAVMAYIAAIFAIIFSTSKLPSPKGTNAPTAPPAGQESKPSTSPPETFPPGASTTAGPTSAPTTQGPTTAAPPGATTTKAPTTAPGATTTKAPTTAPGATTTKAPTTTAPGATTTKAPTTAPGATTTKAPTTAAPTTRAPMTVAPTPPAPTNLSIVPPSQLNGKRGFCFRNSCSETIWIGQIGGATGLSCAGGCPKGTICNTVDETLGCYFSLTFPTPKIALSPGELVCVPFDFDPIITVVHMPTGDVHLDVQWSGALYASTHCDGDLKCQTAVCKACDENMNCKECASFQGPVGPVAQAELTLSNVWKDYYDTTLIQGANLPLVVKPLTYKGSFYPDPLSPPAYHCGRPGHIATDGDSPGSSWKFDNTRVSSTNTMASPLVFGGSAQACKMSSTPSNGCPSGEVCGIQMHLNQWNQPMPEVYDNLCGIPIGVWTRDEICGWTDAYTYTDCKDPAPSGGGIVQQLHMCSGPYAESCIQPTADTNCCGCTVWPDFVPTHGDECKKNNPAWTAVVQPHLEIVKRACPTCYTYPYDDSTALFTCWDDPYENYASYEFEWCPSGVSITF